MAQILDYSRVFYSGGFHYRSPRGLLITSGFGAVVVIMFYYMSLQAGSIPTIVWAVPILMAITEIWLIWTIIIDKPVMPFFIAIDGITISKEFVPWNKIDRFGAAEGILGNGISYLFYATKYSPKVHCKMMSSRTIPRAEFDELSKRLRAELRENYPWLAVGVYEAYQQAD